MNYKNILFDLDGTLTDSKEGIFKSLSYAARKFGLTFSEAELLPYLGPPVFEIFGDILKGRSEEEIALGVKLYRERFERKGYLENKLFDGIPPLLSTLKSKGLTLAVATSKPEIYTIKILEHFKILKYFDYVCGSSLDGLFSKKAEIIKKVIDALRLDKSLTVMVGDRKYDLKGAEQAGIDGIGVLYGYGSREELEDCKHVYLAKDIGALSRLLLNE